MQIDHFPHARLPELYLWLTADRRANFDDYGPQTFGAFEAEIESRLAAGSKLYGVWSEGELVGAVGFRQTGPEWGILQGIVFASHTHGRGIALHGVRLVLEDIFRSGVTKVSAVYFADNVRVGRFLSNLGALSEGCLRKQTKRGGSYVDMHAVAIFR